MLRDFLPMELERSVSSGPGAGVVMKVGFPGERGAYAEAAAAMAFDTDIATRPYPSISAVFEALSKERIALGVVPIENNYAGTFFRTFESFRRYPAYIHKQLQLTTKYALCGQPDLAPRAVKRIFGHPAAFVACEPWLRGIGAVDLRPVFDISACEQRIAHDSNPDEAVLCSSFSANRHGLHIIKENCAGPPILHTTYAVIAMQPAVPEDQEGNIVTMLRFTMQHEAGTMLNALRILAEHKLNILGQKTWAPNDQYAVAFIVVDALFNEARIAEALGALNDLNMDAHHLGSYRRRDIRI